jgi:hypothetical protein
MLHHVTYMAFCKLPHRCNTLETGTRIAHTDRNA